MFILHHFCCFFFNKINSFLKDAANEEFYENTLQYRLIYMILIFYLFRFRFYIAWIFAEISCMTAAFAAYPISSKAKPGAGPTDLEEYNKLFVYFSFLFKIIVFLFFFQVIHQNQTNLISQQFIISTNLAVKWRQQ